MVRQKRRGFVFFISLTILCWLLSYSLFMVERTIETVRSALDMFAHSILPSLALFSVCAKLIVKLGLTKKLASLPLAGFLRFLGMSAGGFTAFLIGSFAGFPTGAAMLAELCERGEISKREAESLLPFCNHAGIAFLFGTVGGVMLRDARMGMILFLAQTITAWICVCLTAHERRDGALGFVTGEFSSPSWISAITVSVRECAFSMIGVGGFVVFFSLIGTALFDTLTAIGFSLNDLFRSVVGGLLEISCGFRILSEGDFSQKIELILAGIFLGVGGCSVFLQAVEKTESFFFSPKKYWKGKALAGIICPIFTQLFFILCEKENGKKLMIVSFASVFCISYFLNYVKIKFFSKKCGKMKRNAV